MSKQIGIVQSSLDEAAFTEWLNQQSNILCLPRIMETPMTDAFLLGKCTNPQQVIFIRDFLPEVIGNIQRIQGKNLFHVYPQNGLCIEWTRSQPKPDNCFVPGRLFYESKNSGWPISAKEVDRIFNRLRKWIIEHSPLCTETKFPIYVGEILAEQVEAGKANVLHRGGSKMDLTNNMKYMKG